MFYKPTTGRLDHRCTWVEISGLGVTDVFAKIPWRVQAFRKNCHGSPYFGFYCIFINKCFEIFLRGVLFLLSSFSLLPNPPPLSASMGWTWETLVGMFDNSLFDNSNGFSLNAVLDYVLQIEHSINKT
jgi:hypothetical protein